VFFGDEELVKLAGEEGGEDEAMAGRNGRRNKGIWMVTRVFIPLNYLTTFYTTLTRLFGSNYSSRLQNLISLALNKFKQNKF
jgi:hypothetical protein